MHKRILLALAVLITISVAGFSIRPYATPRDIPEFASAPITATTVSDTESASVTTVGANLVVDGISHSIPADATVYDAMRALKTAGDFSFEGKRYPSLGFFVESINGKKNAGDYYWILYVNGTSSSLGASATKIRSGDVIEWRYEKGY